ncbi:MAG: precorrin-2 C(20)-methyltransferase [Chitinispirillaceae bacterium]|nr:precorrin-2 C(20)-methyltransferase [Chitinispirillaceae bacterium]
MSGIVHIIGVGPGDPELLTVKAARILQQCVKVFTPVARVKDESLALIIARSYISENANIEELHFPMVTDNQKLDSSWKESARRVKNATESGVEVAFLTIGDPLLYSTSIYLIRALRGLDPDIDIRIVPGIPAFVAAAALTSFSLGEAKQPIHIIPAEDDLIDIRNAIEKGGTVVVMKVGGRLQAILDLLELTNTIKHAVFVSHAGMADQRIETDLTLLRNEDQKTGYLSTILIDAGKGISR